MLDKPKKPYYIDNHGRGSYSQLAAPSINQSTRADGRADNV